MVMSNHLAAAAKARVALTLSLLLQTAAPALAQESGDVAALVRDALRGADRASLSRVEVATSFVDDGAAVAAVPDQILKAFKNVIEYSALSMERRPAKRLQIRVARNGGKIDIEFRDTGPGLSVAEIVAIYGSGATLLAETSRIAADAGGLLQVSSEEGVGTSYLVELPARKATRQTIAAR